MLLRWFYDEKLAQASYLVGCQVTGEALVVDPNRVVEPYLELAEREGLEIAHVTETHIHADFVSGVRELAHRTGATMYLSDEGGADWRYGFGGDGRTVKLRDNDVFMVGNVRVQALHTPGHTPEHLCFLLTDTAGADAPMGVFTGDFVFVGDVGRPDLLERAAGYQGTMAAAASQLYASLQRFRELPEWLQLWPGHGAGSACGKALGAVPQSTLGYEKRFNWAFGHTDEQEFIEAVLAGQPEAPKYFAQMKRINREGPPLLGIYRRPEQLQDGALRTLLSEKKLVVDTRKAANFGAGHVPGTINIPLNRAFTNWSGWLIPYDRDFWLIVDDAADGERIDEAVQDLAMIGLDRVAGWFSASAVDAWRARGNSLEQLAETEPASLAATLGQGGIMVVDVRGQNEWDAGHIPGVAHIPLGVLEDHLDALPYDRQIVLYCQGGGRSGIGASLLQARGFANVSNLRGGFTQWTREGHAVEREPTAVTH
jgi:hydroxyacylglutathione hydrolase